jgi:hypothetical protein
LTEVIREIISLKFELGFKIERTVHSGLVMLLATSDLINFVPTKSLATNLMQIDVQMAGPAECGS